MEFALVQSLGEKVHESSPFATPLLPLRIGLSDGGKKLSFCDSTFSGPLLACAVTMKLRGTLTANFDKAGRSKIVCQLV
jgi:hypothetical protein